MSQHGPAHHLNLKTLVKGSGVVLLGNVFLQLAGFLFNFILARNLGAHGYGTFLVCFGFFQLFLMLSQAGFRSSLIRFLGIALGEEKQHQVRPLVLTTAAVSLLLSILFMLAWFWTAGHWRFRPSMWHNVWVFSRLMWALPFAALATLFVTDLQALRKINPSVALQKLLEPVLRILCLCLLFLTLGVSILSAASSILLGSLFFSLAAGWVLWKNLPPADRPLRESFSLAPLGAVLLFSAPLLLSDMTNYCLQWADTVLLGALSSEASAGLYGAAFRWSTLGSMSLVAVNYVFAPQIYELYGKKDVEGIRRLFQTVTRWLFSVNLPLFFILCFHGPWFLSLFGNEFQKVSFILTILAFGTLFNTSTGPAGELIYMAGRGKAIFYLSAFVGILNFFLNILMIPRWGVLGAALAGTGTVVVSNAVNVFFGWRLTGIQPYNRGYLKPLAAAAVTVFFLGVLRSSGFLEQNFLSLVLSLLLWGTLYPFLLFMMKMEEEDREMGGLFLSRLRALLR